MIEWKEQRHYSDKGGHFLRSDWHKTLPIVKREVGLVSKGDIYMSKFLMNRPKKSGK